MIARTWYRHVPTGRVGVILADAWLEGHVLLDVAGWAGLRTIVVPWRDIEPVRVQRAQRVSGAAAASMQRRAEGAGR